MQRQPVESSNVKAIGHDPESKTLEVEFHNGGVYQYDGVPAEEHAALIKSPTIGGHLHKHIKGKYPHRKV